MPTGNCTACRQYSMSLDSINWRCPRCQTIRTAPAPAEPAPDHRADALKKWVMAEIKLAARIGGSCGGCQFSVMVANDLRCHRMPPVIVAGSGSEFPAVLPFSSCGEFAPRKGELTEEEYSFGGIAGSKEEAEQQVNAAGLGVAAGAVVADMAGDAAAIAGYLWYLDQVQDAYIQSVVGVEDSGNFFTELFNF